MVSQSRQGLRENEQTESSPLLENLEMDSLESSHIIAVERHNTGIVIQFADGNCFFYSQEMLQKMQPEAEALDESNVAW